MRNGLIIYLVDTNIFVYAYLDDDSNRSPIAREVLDELSRRGTGCVSTQVLNELFVRLTRGVQDRRKIEEASENVSALIADWQVLDTTTDIVLEALHGVTRYQLAYWDSLLWAAAKLNGVPYILSEDFSHGQTLDGVTFLNPFTSGFTLDRYPA